MASVGKSDDGTRPKKTNQKGETTMKKILSAVLVVALCFAAVATLASCKKEHEHEISADWSKDATDHWKTCAGCEELIDKAAHTWSDPVKSAGAYTSTCTVCGEQKVTTYDADVTAEEFAAAFDFGDTYKVVLAATSPTDGTYAVTLISNPGKMQQEMVETDLEGNTDTESAYLSHEDGKLYMYDADYDDNGTLLGYEKRDMSEWMEYDEYTSMVTLQFFPSEFRAFESFTYNTTTKRYEAASITVQSIGTMDCSDIALEFEDGKLVKASWTLASDGETENYTLTISYTGVPTVTLPAPYTPAE